MANNRSNGKFVISEKTKEALRASGDDDNLHVVLRGGVPAVFDPVTGLHSRKKIFERTDARTAFAAINMFNNTKVEEEKKKRLTMDRNSFKDPRVENNQDSDSDSEYWSDWSYR
jgi:hypothetical protein